MKLPVLSGKEVLRILSKHGYHIHDQKGSHVHLRHPVRPPLTVPLHNEISKGTLKAIIEVSGLTREDFAGR